MLPPPGCLMYESRFIVECSGTLLNFSPCPTFHIYFRHFWTSYLSSNPPLQEGRVVIAWGPSYLLIYPCFPAKCSVSHFRESLYLITLLKSFNYKKKLLLSTFIHYAAQRRSNSESCVVSVIIILTVFCTSSSKFDVLIRSSLLRLEARCLTSIKAVFPLWRDKKMALIVSSSRGVGIQPTD
jgi:hypothetical protein